MGEVKIEVGTHVIQEGDHVKIYPPGSSVPVEYVRDKTGELVPLVTVPAAPGGTPTTDPPGGAPTDAG